MKNYVLTQVINRNNNVFSVSQANQFSTYLWLGYVRFVSTFTIALAVVVRLQREQNI